MPFFPILSGAMSPRTVKYFNTCVCLHNFSRLHFDFIYQPCLMCQNTTHNHRSFNTVSLIYYRSRTSITELHSDRFCLVNVAAVLENVHSLHHSSSGEVNLDPVAILFPFGEPGTVIWMVPTVYSQSARCKLVTGCACSTIYAQRNIKAPPCEEIINCQHERKKNAASLRT